MTASEEHEPERRHDERRQVAQPAYYGENRSTVRRAGDAPAPVAQQQAADPTVPSVPGAVPQQDYEFLTGLIQMEHSN